jgi:curved DNA-binding protein CbpA
MKAAPAPPLPAAASGVEEPRATEKKPPPAEEEVDERQALEELFARLERATNYYHVLGVNRSASPDIIKRTYHGLARRFHPDRFHHGEDAGLHARVEAAFAQIAQAYETLKDRQARAVYDMKIEREGAAYGGKVSAVPRPSAAQSVKATTSESVSTQASRGQSAASADLRAEESFRQGMAALKRGDRQLAITFFGEAARLVPRQPRYRAYYGQALGANVQTHHQAEAEMQAAITLDAGNVFYRVMLAQFYLDLGFQRRAQGELERAVAIDPHNMAARQMLEKLK